MKVSEITMKSGWKIILLSLALIIISSIFITSVGNTYTVVFHMNDTSNYPIFIEDDDEKISIVSKQIKDNEYRIKVKAKKAGKVGIYLDYGQYQTGKILYIHKNMVITEDNYFGKATGSEIIPISLTFILIYGLFLLKKRYTASIKENIYQYKNISYLGLMIFISFFAINNLISITNYRGLFETVERTLNALAFVSLALLPIAFLSFVLVTISNLNLIRKEGISLKNLLGLIFGIVICILTILPDASYQFLMKTQIFNIYNLNSIGPYIYDFIETLVYLTVAYLECILIATIIIAIKSVRRKIEKNKDYMIILGCKIKQDGSLTPLLKGRVEKALEFRNLQLKETGKDLVFIPSGGKGSDEIISEAEAIKNYLIEQGIKEKNILIENKSKNTFENIKFSNKLVKKKGANIGFSTTNYHVMRAGLIATEQGLKLEGIGSKTKSYFWINAFIREFIGTLYSEKKKHLFALLWIIVFIIIMISIKYIGNNL